MVLLGPKTEEVDIVCSDVEGGEMRERSSMKLPAAMLVGVRGK